MPVCVLQADPLVVIYLISLLNSQLSDYKHLEKTTFCILFLYSFIIFVCSSRAIAVHANSVHNSSHEV